MAMTGALRRRFTSAATLLLVMALASACAPDFRERGASIAAPEFHDKAIIASDGHALPLTVWPSVGKPQAIILALHGFTDYSNAFALSAPSWATQGITTYAYDQRGFGANEPLRWAGTDTYVTDARQALALLRHKYPDLPIFLLGESMGGAAAILAVTETDTAADVADGLILVAPAVLDRPQLSEFEHDFLDVTVNLMPWAMSGKRGVPVPPTDNYDLLRAMGRDPLVQKEVRYDQVYGLLLMIEAASARIDSIDLPTLALFGGKDKILPKGAHDYFASHNTGQIATGQTEIHYFPDAYHMMLRDLEALPRREMVAAWVLAHVNGVGTGDPGATVVQAGTEAGQ